MKRTIWAASLISLAVFAAGVQAQDTGAAATEPSVDAARLQLPEAVLILINDKRAATELTDEELKQRARNAWKLARDESLAEDVRDQLQALADADRTELEAREKAAAGLPQPDQGQGEIPAPPAAPALPKPVADLLVDEKPAVELSDAELQQRLRAAREFSRDQSLPEDVRNRLAAMAKAARAEIAAREKAKQDGVAATPQVEEQPQQAEQPPAPQPGAEPQQAGQPTKPSVVDQAEAQQLDGNTGDPQAEALAKSFLTDAVAADQLSDDKLRERLEAMRDLMEQNKLSKKTERALRQKLRADRQVLRARIAKAKAEEEAKAAAAEAEKKAKEQAAAAAAEQNTTPAKKSNIFVITPETPRRVVLQDRRPSEELDDSELRIRIRVYRDFELDPAYQDFDEDQRIYWRETIRRDRERLRRRLEEERNVRRVEYERRSNIRRIEIDDDDYADADDYEDDVFAAEVDEEDIERVLVAPPRKKVRRVASVDDIERRPDVRNSLRRIEIDTIRFGFNEAFVREEEIDALDQIALVIERILRRYPRERFLIEGHTDAVGSDAYNLKLSRARAQAVKKALTSFYLIPARNLETVGLGERYLKIPTAEPEPENRRVSISRATAVLGEIDDD